jgi:RNA polymerase sigma-70 factor (ECF subfamily)
MNLQNSKELQEVIKLCHSGDRKAQERLFSISYPLAMNVCRRYTHDLDEAKSLVNEGMLKVFTQLSKYSPELSYGGWLRKIMINTAIDHYRKAKIFQDRFRELEGENIDVYEQQNVIDKISADELLTLVQELPPAYRVVFSLYAVEEYTHKEIAEQLGISEGTSKSNYAKAKAKLQKAMASLHPINGINDGQRR